MRVQKGEGILEALQPKQDINELSFVTLADGTKVPTNAYLDGIIEYANQPDKFAGFLHISPSRGSKKEHFLLPGSGNQPAGHWCARSIRYYIDFGNADKYGLSLKNEVREIQRAFDVWNAASGGKYKFSYAGPISSSRVHNPVTDNWVVNTDNVGPGSIIITYGSSKSSVRSHRYPNLSGDILGIGGVSPLSENNEIDRGFLILDQIDLSQSDPLKSFVVRVHEIGHALGLGHSNNTKDIMYSFATSNPALGMGDVRSITALTNIKCQ